MGTHYSGIQVTDEDVEQYWPRYFHLGTTVVTGLHVDFVSLTSALWVWLFSQFSIHLTVHFSNLHFLSLFENVTGDSVRGFTKAVVNNTNCSPFIHQASDFILESYQVDLIWLSFHKSMLTVPFLSFMYLVVFQENFLHHLSQDKGETDPPVVVLSFLCTLPEDRTNILPLPVFRKPPHSPWLFKGNWEGPHNYISLSYQGSCMQPIRAHGLVYI